MVQQNEDAEAELRELSRGELRVGGGGLDWKRDHLATVAPGASDIPPEELETKQPNASSRHMPRMFAWLAACNARLCVAARPLACA